MVNNPILYDAIPTFWLVAIQGFLIISSVCGIVKVMSIVVPVAASERLDGRGYFPHLP